MVDHSDRLIGVGRRTTRCNLGSGLQRPLATSQSQTASLFMQSPKEAGHAVGSQEVQVGR